MDDERNNLEQGRDHADRVLDANLSEFGASLRASAARGDEGAERALRALRAELGAGELGEIKSAARERWAEEGARPLVMRRRVWAGLSAAAAAVAVTGALLVPYSRGGEVNAAMILTSLRERTIRGVQIEFRHFAAEGAVLDGTVRAVVDPPLDVAKIVDAAGAGEFEPGPETAGAGAGNEAAGVKGARSAALAGSVRAEITDPALRGVTLEFNVGLSHESKWAMVSAPVLPRGSEARRVNRQALSAIEMFIARGVVLDFSSLDMDAVQGFSEQVQRAFGPTAEQVTATGRGGFTLGWDPRRGVVAGAFPPGAGGAQGAGDTQGLVRLVGSLLSGRADKRDLDEFSRLIQEAGTSAKVIGLGGGRYALESTPPAGAGAECGVALMRLVYEQDVGIESIEMRSSLPGKDGSADGGSIVITFADEPIDPAGLDYQRLLTPGTLILDSSWLNEFLRNGGPLMRRFMSPQDAGAESGA